MDEVTSAPRLSALPPDGILRFTLLGGAIRGALAHGTAMACSMRANHGLGVLETLALGQAYLGGALAAVTLKDGSRLGFRVDCTGVLRGFSVEAWWDGRVRGYLFNESVALDKPLESFDLAPFIGGGTLSVTRFAPDAEPFTGHIPLVHGRIAEDLTEYFLRSEQTRTAVSVGVRFDSAGRVSGAGGLFLQAMPGVSDIDIEDAEVRLSEMPSLSDWFAQGKTSSAFLADWFGAFEPNVVGSGPLVFECDCSRERFAGYLGALPGRELRGMIDEGPDPAEIVCHNCSSRYYFSKDDLSGLLAGGVGA